jgi:hypothetical protein
VGAANGFLAAENVSWTPGDMTTGLFWDCAEPDPPSQYQFGSVPSAVGRPAPQTLTGSRVPNPASLVHPNYTPASFVAPAYNSAGPGTTPSLAAVLASHGQTIASLGGLNTGASPSVTARPAARPAPPPSVPFSQQLAALTQHGYQPVSNINFASPQRQVSTTPYNGLADTYEGRLQAPVSTSALIAALAQSGQRIGSRGPGAFYS